MNIPSSLKLLSVFLIGAGSATALLLSGGLARQSSDKLSNQAVPAQASNSPKSPGAASALISSSDRKAREATLPPRANPEAASMANFPTNPNAASSSPSAYTPASRSAFASSAAAVDAPATPARSLATPPSSASSFLASGASASNAGTGASLAASPSYGASQPSNGGYSYAAPSTGGGSSAAPASATIEISPAATIPASLAQPNPAANLTPEEQNLAEDLGKQFLDEVGGVAPSDPAGENTWNKAQQKNDALYKLYFGYQAYNAQSGSAYRDSIQPAQGN